MAKKAISEDLISSAKAAELIGVSVRRLQVLAAPRGDAPARLPPAIRAGRAALFRRADVIAFGSRSRKPGRPKKAKGGAS